MLVQIVDRLRTARACWARSSGAISRARWRAVRRTRHRRARVPRRERERTTAAIADIIREIGRQGGALAAMAGELATSARELQAASQSISNTTHQLSEGTERQRQLSGTGARIPSGLRLATTLHARAQEAERQITKIALQAHKRGRRWRREHPAHEPDGPHDHASEVAAVLDRESKEIASWSTASRASRAKPICWRQRRNRGRARRTAWLGFRVVAGEVRNWPSRAADQRRKSEPRCARRRTRSIASWTPCRRGVRRRRA